ncbi:MAG TPA: tyrosine-type recombinase/integrase [Casimicrobiaceae bacterium]
MDIDIRFDPAEAKRLKPGESIAFPEAPGLRLERSSSGWLWSYRYRSPIDDALRQIKLGNWPRLPLHRAVDAWETRRNERNAGRDPALEHRQERQKARADSRTLTVAKLAEVYVEALGKLDPKKKAPRRKERGRLEVQRMFDHDLGALAKRKAAEITPADAVAFLEGVRDRAPNIALRLRRELSATWRMARARSLLPADAANPWPDALLGELSQGERERVLTAGELRAVLRFLPNYTPIVADALELTLRSCLRSGEVVALRSAWFEESDGELWADIPGAHMKGRRPHRVPFVGRARAIVEARLGGEFLFKSEAPRGNGHIQQKALGVAVHFHSKRSVTRPEVERARCPVEDWAPHDLRRTGATLLGDLGCPFEIIEAILAHRLPGVSSRYQRSKYTTQKVEWLKKLNAHIDAIAASESVRQLHRKAAA